MSDSTGRYVGRVPAPDLKAFGPLVLMAFAGMFVYSAAEQALWNFAYNLPIEAGVDPALAPRSSLITTIMGLGWRSHRGSARCAVGAGLSNRLGLHCLSLRVAGCTSILDEWLDAAGRVAALGTRFLFRISPYQIGLVAAADRKGALPWLRGVRSISATRSGPGIAGRILQYMDREWLVVDRVASTIASMLLILPLAIRGRPRCADRARSRRPLGRRRLNSRRSRSTVPIPTEVGLKSRPLQVGAWTPQSNSTEFPAGR